MNQNS